MENFRFDATENLIYMGQDGKDAPYWFFAADLRNLTDQHSNHEVDVLLRHEGVLLPYNETDPEYCCFWAYFPTFVEGESFIERLNDYLWPSTY